MKIFLTGGGGMVGRSFRLHPAARDHEIVAPSSGELDLRDRGAVQAAFQAIRPDAVVHAAGRVGGIHANLSQPVGFLVDNIDMGFNVLLAARAARVPMLINIGSGSMFPAAAPNPLEEDSILHGPLDADREGYCLSKIAVERLCNYISREDESLAYKSVIPCNLYGPFDKFDPRISHFMPAIIRKIHDAKQSGRGTVEIWGDGQARRELLFGMDLADLLWEGLLNYGRLPTLMNVGVGKDYSINEYYRIVADVVGWKGEFTHDLTKAVGVHQRLVSTRRQDAFGWKPKTSLEEGIRKTYAYFLEHQS